VVNDWSLSNQMGDVPQNLIDFRRLSREAVDAYGIRWDTYNKSWVLPIRTPKGVLLGAQYRQKGNELNLPEGLEKSQTLFGIAEMKRHDTCALVESPLDAVRLYGLSIPAVASFGAWVSPQQSKLLRRTFSVVVIALDNDKPGRESAYNLMREMHGGTGAVMFDYTGLVDKNGDPAKDVGDVVSDDDLWDAWQRTLGMGLS
jgi:hypothetical protein